MIQISFGFVSLFRERDTHLQKPFISPAPMSSAFFCLPTAIWNLLQFSLSSPFSRATRCTSFPPTKSCSGLHQFSALIFYPTYLLSLAAWLATSVLLSYYWGTNLCVYSAFMSSFSYPWCLLFVFCPKFKMFTYTSGHKLASAAYLVCCLDVTGSFILYNMSVTYFILSFVITFLLLFSAVLLVPRTSTTNCLVFKSTPRSRQVRNYIDTACYLSY